MKGNNTSRINMLKGTLTALGLKYAAGNISTLIQDAEKAEASSVEMLLRITQYESSERLSKIGRAHV